MKVYRVEHKVKRLGPWNGPSDYVYPTKQFDANKMPLPYMVGLSNDGEGAFGFIELKELRHWFSERDVARLHLQGFVLRCYNVPPRHIERAERTSQVVYDYRKACPLYTLPIHFLHKGTRYAHQASTRADTRPTEQTETRIFTEWPATRLGTISAE